MLSTLDGLSGLDDSKLKRFVRLRPPTFEHLSAPGLPTYRGFIQVFTQTITGFIWLEDLSASVKFVKFRDW